MKPASSDTNRASASLGMSLFLFSLGMFFAAACVAFLWVRLRGESWQPGLARGQAAGLALASACLLGCDAAVLRARRSANGAARRRLSLALALGLLYGAVQTWNWIALAPALRGEQELEAFTFIVLTSLHAAHVVGGLGHLGFLRLRRGSPSTTELLLTARYWRFLSCVWLALVALLLAS